MGDRLLQPHLFNSLDELYLNVLRTLVDEPQYICSPRGQKIHEMVPCSFTLADPRRRLIAAAPRDVNYGFAVGEFLWYWNGREDLETMLYYNKRMENFSDDGITLNSAYGKRIRGFYGIESLGRTQWQNAVETLLRDHDSRRAVLIVNLPRDEYDANSPRGSKDVPCTLALQFLIRDGSLDLHVTMRSNDVVWGLPYDVFSFTLLQECMLLDLNEKLEKKLNLGFYHHTAASMHLYERHFVLAKRSVEWYEQSAWVSALLPTPPLLSLRDLRFLSIDEEDLRRKVIPQIDVFRYDGLTRWLAGRLNEHRRKRDAENAK